MASCHSGGSDILKAHRQTSKQDKGHRIAAWYHVYSGTLMFTSREPSVLHRQDGCGRKPTVSTRISSPELIAMAGSRPALQSKQNLRSRVYIRPDRTQEQVPQGQGTRAVLSVSPMDSRGAGLEVILGQSSWLAGSNRGRTHLTTAGCGCLHHRHVARIDAAGPVQPLSSGQLGTDPYTLPSCAIQPKRQGTLT